MLTQQIIEWVRSKNFTFQVNEDEGNIIQLTFPVPKSFHQTNRVRNQDHVTRKRRTWGYPSHFEQKRPLAAPRYDFSLSVS